MRTRSRSGSEPPEEARIHTWYSGYGSCATPIAISPGADVYSTFVPSEWSEVMHDVVTPAYVTRSHNGEIINNPYDKVRTETQRKKIKWEFSKIQGYWSTCSGVPTYFTYTGGVRASGYQNPNTILGSAYLAAPVISIQPIIDLAVTGAFAKTDTQEVQGLVVLAEADKTIRSFVAIASRLIKILRAARKWDKDYLRRQLSAKELADRWMEGRYAIRPVVYDIVDIVAALKKVHTIKPYRQTFRSGHSASSTSSQTGVAIYTSPGTCVFYATKNSTRSVSVRSGVLAAVEAISNAAIWGFTQPFTAMWELVPFSFVVDWFFNVGKTIASWSPAYGLRTLASWATVRDTVLQSIAVTHAVFSPDFNPVPPYSIYEKWISATEGFVQKTTTSTYRVPNPSRPILPTWNVRLDAAKLLDLTIIGKRFINT